NPVAADPAVLDVHHFDDVDLLAVRRLPGILPDQPAAVAEVPAVAVPAHQIVRPPPGAFAEEGADLFVAAQDAVIAVHDRGHQRALELGVRRVQRQQALDVAGLGQRVPGLVDGGDGVVHACVPAASRCRVAATSARL